MIDVRAYGTLRTTCVAAGGQRQRDEGGEQQGDRKVPLPSLPRRQHRAQQSDARVANGLLSPAPQAPPVHREECGRDEQ